MERRYIGDQQEFPTRNLSVIYHDFPHPSCRGVDQCHQLFEEVLKHYLQRSRNQINIRVEALRIRCACATHTFETLCIHWKCYINTFEALHIKLWCYATFTCYGFTSSSFYRCIFTCKLNLTSTTKRLINPSYNNLKNGLKVRRKYERLHAVNVDHFIFNKQICA